MMSSTATRAEPLVLKINDAAEALNCHRTTVERMIGRGELAAVTVGRHRAIPVAEIHRVAGVPA